VSNADTFQDAVSPDAVSPEVLPGDEHTRPELGRAALLTIDMQADVVSGPHAVPGTDRVLPSVAGLAQAFRDAGRPIVHLVRLYLPDGSNADRCRRAVTASGRGMLVAGSPGTRLAGSLIPGETTPDEHAADEHDPDGGLPLDTGLLLSGAFQSLGDREHVLYKPRWSAFYQTALQRHLDDRGVATLVVAGCNYPNCPRATVYDASARDYRLVLADDAVSGFSEQARREMTGIAAWCLPVTTITGLLRAAAASPGREHAVRPAAARVDSAGDPVSTARKPAGQAW
jgi:nicotinamidase-related amidase